VRWNLYLGIIPECGNRSNTGMDTVILFGANLGLGSSKPLEFLGKMKQLLESSTRA
jgi:hypothetical protein